MNDKRAVVNVRRVMYGNRPTKVPVKGAQTNCTCDCHTSPKVTPAATLTTFCLPPNIFSLCSMKIPKRITFLLRIEMRSHFSVYWERAFCLPLDGERLFRGGKVFVLCHLVWCAGEMGMKAIKQSQLGKKGECGAPSPYPACVSPRHLYAEGASFFVRSPAHLKRGTQRVAYRIPRPAASTEAS